MKTFLEHLHYEIASVLSHLALSLTFDNVHGQMATAATECAHSMQICAVHSQSMHNVACMTGT